jgi:hypothetical protein
MTSVKMPVVGGEVVRVTLEDSCGRPAYGNHAQIVSDGIVSVAVTANYDDGNEKVVTNFKGNDCVYVPPRAKLRNLGIDVVMCAVDPDMYSGLTGFPKEIDPVTGNIVGFRVDRSISPSDVALALELWASSDGTIACEDDEDPTSGWFLWPFLTGGRIGDYTIEDNAVTFSITGLTTRDGSGWGVGPYNVLLDAAGQPSGLLSPIGPKELQVVRSTQVPPPEATDGFVPLDDPEEPDATGATAGIPGAFTPTGGVRPFDLATLRSDALTASPGTAWTTGQHIILGDGSKAHWDSNSWEAGAAS